MDQHSDSSMDSTYSTESQKNDNMLKDLDSDQSDQDFDPTTCTSEDDSNSASPKKTKKTI